MTTRSSVVRAAGASFAVNEAAEARMARDWIVGTNVAFLVAAVMLFLDGWHVIAVHSVLVAITSFLYHVNSESAQFALLDQALATMLFFHLAITAFSTGCLLTWISGAGCFVLWKLGHKCHCEDRAVCGHPYGGPAAFAHGAMHLVSALGAVSVVFSGAEPSLNPFSISMR